MLYIMRHGKTDWNEKRKLQGRTDIPLNAQGRKMAQEAAGQYHEVPLDLCFCSPLSRARETAEIVLRGRNVPIRCDNRLQEMGFGQLEGLENAFRAGKDSPAYALFHDPVHYVPAEGGESFEALFDRTGEFLKEIQPLLQAGKDVLIVGHGAMNSSIVCQVQKKPLEQFWDAGLEQCRMMRLIS